MRPGLCGTIILMLIATVSVTFIGSLILMEGGSPQIIRSFASDGILISWKSMLAAAAASMLSLVLITFWLVRTTIIQPLNAARHGLAAITHNEFGYRLPSTRTHEFRMVADTFNQMASHLQSSYGKVADEQRKLLLALDASQDGIWVTDSRQRITMVNTALEHLTGYQRDQLFDQPCCGLLGIRALDGTALCDVACPFVHPHAATTRHEGRISTASGADVWVEISYGRITDQHNQLIGVMHVVHDLTQRKQVERLKDELLSIVSHELRTPLHHIKGFASTLLQTDVTWDTAVQRDFLASIDREADRLAHMVEKILDLSRLESGHLPLRPVRCSAAELLDGALARTHTLTIGRPMDVCIPEGLPSVVVDDEQIERVLINLIENAVKYSNPETPLAVSVALSDRALRFAVEDQGVGIPLVEQERIFERFYRVGARSAAGAGLGLVICKRIVEAHHGSIGVNSTPGVGSRFWFDLPIEFAGQSQQARCRHCLSPTNGRCTRDAR